ncbi:MAG TPA: phytanoyl-CoA dioxygenase family protein [Pyrinomonadaceae bacterium]|nr:phytanoyl-CoA dioxygenase family protein [Pyrinomonadaceae bacterium]
MGVEVITLTRRQKRLFAEQGYTVVPRAVPRRLIVAARREAAGLLAREPPPAGQRGPYSYFLKGDAAPRTLRALLSESTALAAAESLIAPAKFEAPEHVQLSLNFPPFDHLPGGPHVDGLAPPEEDGRPGTFTLLAGVFLTDQTAEQMGNLWVWPGSHRAAAEYFREHGADALLTSSPYPPVELSAPRQVTGRAGDLLLAHYLLGHNIGGNTSEVTREVVYFRLRREGHKRRWREFVQDASFEFDSQASL